jgi:hypothetical protein
MSAVAAEGVWKLYGDYPALRDVILHAFLPGSRAKPGDAPLADGVPQAGPVQAAIPVPVGRIVGYAILGVSVVSLPFTAYLIAESPGASLPPICIALPLSMFAVGFDAVFPREALKRVLGLASMILLVTACPSTALLMYLGHRSSGWGLCATKHLSVRLHSARRIIRPCPLHSVSDAAVVRER